MNRKTRKGYTLVEILIGVFIMSIGMVSILGAFPIGIQIVTKIKRTTMLCNFAVMKMAEYQAYANPQDTLCVGESVNPYQPILQDQFCNIAGINRSSDTVTGLVNGLPDTGDNGSRSIKGAGKNLHWKIADFEYYVQNQSSLYDVQIRETDYSSVVNTSKRMGLTQNNRRFEEAYGFTRKYIIEVWAGDPETKTDTGFTAGTDVLEAYYAFSTAIWNPHLMHSTEWGPVMEGATYSSPRCEGNHDYYWTWNNKLEGWGFENSGDGGGRSWPATGEQIVSFPSSPGTSNWPWL